MRIPVYKVKYFDEKAIDPWQKRLVKRIRICPFCTPGTKTAIHFGNNPYDTWSYCLNCGGVSYVWDNSKGDRVIRSKRAEDILDEIQALVNGEISGSELAYQRYLKRKEQ